MALGALYTYNSNLSSIYFSSITIEATGHRLIERIRAHWPDVRILIRGDSGFARDALMAFLRSERRVRVKPPSRRGKDMGVRGRCV
jgi:hypothetical protein